MLHKQNASQTNKTKYFKQQESQWTYGTANNMLYILNGRP